MDRVASWASWLDEEASAFRWQVTYEGGPGKSFVGNVVIDEPLAVLVGSVATYCALVLLCKGVVLTCGPTSLRFLLGVRRVHNLSLSLFSLAVFAYTTFLMVSEGHFSSLREAACAPVRSSHFQAVSFVFLLSKVWEWFDTVLLVANGSKVKMLHLLHHMTTFWLYAVDHLFLSSIKYGVAVNALIHFVMYAHYFKPFPKRFRPLITQMQIAQFLLSIYLHSAIYFQFDCDQLVRSHWIEYLTPYLLVGTYLVLFLNFYATQYLWNKASGKPKSQ